MADALKELDERMKKNHDYHLISRKGTKPILGRVVSPGQMAVWNRNGRPVIAMRSGNYWNLSARPSRCVQAVSELTRANP